jgi:phosphoribosyl 1,2-cyclic phosphodiesterase
LSVAGGVSLTIFGSSSSGNCSLIRFSEGALLIDCGFPLSHIAEHLASEHLRWSDLTALLLTHTHGDHIQPAVVRRLWELKIPVAAPPNVLQSMVKMNLHHHRVPANLLRPTGRYGDRIGPFDIRAFPVPHDSRGGCSAYRIRIGAGKSRRQFAFATDLASVPDGLAEAFADSDVIAVESNHDLAMLESSERPESLKRRIRERGHLSNRACGQFVREILGTSRCPPRAVALIHLSRECNRPELARTSLLDAITGLCPDTPRICCADPFVPTPSFMAS